MKRVYKVTLFNGYLALRLGANKIGIDPTQQRSYSGAVALASSPKWSKELLKFWKFDHDILPPIYQCISVVGKINDVITYITDRKKERPLYLVLPILPHQRLQ